MDVQQGWSTSQDHFMLPLTLQFIQKVVAIQTLLFGHLMKNGFLKVQ